MVPPKQAAIEDTIEDVRDGFDYSSIGLLGGGAKDWDEGFDSGYNRNEEQDWRDGTRGGARRPVIMPQWPWSNCFLEPASFMTAQMIKMTSQL